MKINFTPFFVLLFLLFGIGETGFCNTAILPLQNKLRKAKNNKEKFDILMKLTTSYFSTAPEKAVIYGKQALGVAKKLDDKEKIAGAMLKTATAFYYLSMSDSCEKYCLQVEKMGLTGNSAPSINGFAFHMLSIVNKNKGKYTEALQYSKKALKIQLQRKDNYSYACALSTVASIMQKVGKYKPAVDSFYKALNVFILLNDTLSQIESYNNIANLYMDIGKDSLAMDYYFRAKAMMENDTDSREYAGLLTNIGILQYDKKAYDSAINCYLKAMQYYNKTGNTLEIAGLWQNIGNALIAKGNYLEGLRYLKNAYNVFIQKHHYEDVANISLDIGNGYLDLKKYDSTEYFLNRSLKLSDSLNNFYIKSKSTYALFEFYHQKHDDKKALAYFMDYSNEQDSMAGVKVQNKIMEFKTKYETEKKESEIKILKSKEKTQRDKNRFLFFLLLLTCIVFLLIIILFVVKRKKEKQTAQLKSEQEKLRAENLMKENEYQSNQLATHALHMMQKNRMLKELHNELSIVEKSLDDEKRERIRKLKRSIIKNINSDKDWKIFKRYFEYIHTTFFTAIKEAYPKLTTYDVRLAALIKLNLSNNEIATALNIAPGSVKTARHRLKKKMNLNSQTELDRFIGLFPKNKK